MRLNISEKIESKLESKHDVSKDEVRQCFENRSGNLLEDSREEHQTNPPTQWFISYTNNQRLLKVVFVLKDGVIHLKTAYEPNQDEQRIYNQYGA